MKTQTAIEHFGNRAALASAIGVDPSATHHWGAEVPELRQYQIQVVTRNKLKADKASKQKKAA